MVGAAVALGEGEIDEAVLLKLRIDCYVEQSAVLHLEREGNTCKRAGVEGTMSQSAYALGMHRRRGSDQSCCRPRRVLCSYRAIE